MSEMGLFFECLRAEVKAAAKVQGFSLRGTRFIQDTNTGELLFQGLSKRTGRSRKWCLFTVPVASVVSKSSVLAMKSAT
jgi:hypothetical protein